MVTRRVARVQDLLRDELSALLAREVQDPRIGWVTITRVDVTADLSLATIHVSVLGEDAERTEALAGLDRARGYLRRRLATRLEMRRLPELRFQFDPSIAHGDRINRLLKDLAPGDTGGTERDVSPEDAAPAAGHRKP